MLKARVRHMAKLHLRNKQKRDGKMAQWVEVLAVKPDDQNSSLKNPHGEWREQTP